MRIDPKYNYRTTPVAFDHSVVKGDKYRFTILTSRLIRIEYNENGHFEDRATQTVINRQFEKVDFSVKETDNSLVITTNHIELSYTKQPFSKYSLKVRYVGELSHYNIGKSSSYWFFGDDMSHYNFGGTTRTLDGVNGECELENGIMAAGGKLSIIDDSNTLALGEDGWVEPRTEECIDMYLFCYASEDYIGYDYQEALCDFYKLTGQTPLLPRYTLGNWWSRYYEYTQDEYLELMARFKANDIPFSVSVIDMDWHYVNIDKKYGNGWTGYTWNKELFPDHVAMLKKLHDEGMHVTLNVHPQDGIAAHEKAYPEMAKAMGIDPETEQKVEFDITDPKFLEKYFSIVHHPLEKEGVDFWWMDWQQGNTTSIPGLDPLWMLNHYHYIDNGRNGKRPLAFSRYSGPGSHRYPVGFSGDTYITWDSLKFQPYFTATASNIGYGWWSHDIGGHMGGVRDEELITRWLQLGTFSPINRLHSGKNEFMGKEPWKYNKINELSMKKFLKLRHELIPYLYSMNHRAHIYGEPLIQPMYYRYRCDDYLRDSTHLHKNEFSFGTEMIVAPITKPADSETTIASTDAYLPEGLWFDFFTNLCYKGGRDIEAYRDIYEMPVFVKAGGIVPMAKLAHVNDTENPETLRVRVYAGADNTFELYEDDGITMDYQNGKYAITKMELKWSDKPEFIIYAPQGDTSVIPQNRKYEIEFVGFDTAPEIKSNASAIAGDNDGIITVCVNAQPSDISIAFVNTTTVKKNDKEKALFKLLEPCRIENNHKVYLWRIATDKKLTLSEKLLKLSAEKAEENVYKAIREIIMSDSE